MRGIMGMSALAALASLIAVYIVSSWTHDPTFKITDDIIRQLIDAVDADRVIDCTPAVLSEDIAKRCMVRDSSIFQPVRADVVVRPMSTDEVSRVMKICHENRIPVTASGAKTGLEGNNLPMRGGVAMDMLLMDKVLEVHADDMQLTLQTGIMKTALQKWCDENGYLLAIDPGSDASIGGYLSTGASGTLTPKYGTVRENVVRLRIVLPDGRVMWTRSRAKKSSAGYDINRIFLGSEGTLGVITEVTLKLVQKPAHILASVVKFEHIVDAANAVIGIEKVRPPTLARCELLNTEAIKAVNRKFNLGLEDKPHLFFEFHDSSPAGRAAHADSDAVEEICARHHAHDYRHASSEQERDALWQGRKGAYYAAFMARDVPAGGQKRLLVTDVVVPISRFSDILGETKRDFGATKHKLQFIVVGHAIDGNFHVLCPFDAANEDMVRELHEVEERMVYRAIEMGGSCTGEHSIGLGKMKYMEREHGEVAIGVMQAIKHAIDGHNTMNPDKIFPYGDYPEFAGQVRDSGRGGCGCEESVTLDKTEL